MIISKRRYFLRYVITMLVLGTVIVMAVPIANVFLFHFPYINDVCRRILICEAIIVVIALALLIVFSGGIKNLISKIVIRHYVESNLISIGAYIKKVGNYAKLPKIKIKNGIIRISLSNLRVRSIIERYLSSFSTALPDRYVVEDYFITTNNAEVQIIYSDIKTYKPEEFCIKDYISKVKQNNVFELYFDKKHVVDVRDYPHFLISGSSGSGKSYLANELVIQAIAKGWEITICDIKRSYGLYKAYSDYVYEIDDIVNKLQQIESEMHQRLQALQSELDNNPHALAVDIGYRPMLVVVEEYISLISSLDKKQRDEVERIVFPQYL